ncbi:hypothetical protein GCM10023220_11660 [Streptomyces ziwulingensis]|uniref:Uncharacterized protein n=1 Tax=Streptomyces ziwulingensis TaxID=1045501 RepID=A0ABP9B2E4_9ACTN
MSDGGRGFRGDGGGFRTDGGGFRTSGGGFRTGGRGFRTGGRHPPRTGAPGVPGARHLWRPYSRVK